MKRTLAITAFLVVVGLFIGSRGLAGKDEDTNLKARLTGFQETPPILTDGKGVFSASLESGSIAYTLTFSGLSSTATASTFILPRGV